MIPILFLLSFTLDPEPYLAPSLFLFPLRLGLRRLCLRGGGGGRRGRLGQLARYIVPDPVGVPPLRGIHELPADEDAEVQMIATGKPVLPLLPSVSPRATLCPTFTPISDMCP